MTKIAYKTPLNGTGTYTLRAPETNSDHELELPTSGTHLASANADGMPELADGTPVVESGSNSDGEWTRWADGTQHSQGVEPTTGGWSSYGSFYQTSDATWNYPVSFINTPAVTTEADSTSMLSGCEANLGSASARAVFQVNTASLPRQITFIATGRWK